MHASGRYNLLITQHNKGAMCAEMKNLRMPGNYLTNKKWFNLENGKL